MLLNLLERLLFKLFLSIFIFACFPEVCCQDSNPLQMQEKPISVNSSFLSMPGAVLTSSYPLQNSEKITNELAQQAEEFFLGGLYTQAIFAYQELINQLHLSNEQGLSLLKARFRLAQAYFLNEQYSETLSVLKFLSISKTDSRHEIEEMEKVILYLSGAAWRNLGKYEQASIELAAYLQSGERSSLPLADEAEFELALAYFLSGKHSLAAGLFESLALSSTKPLALLSDFYLIRICLLDRNVPGAQERLVSLSDKIPKDSFLQFEYAYLQAEVFFKMEQYAKAIASFEKAMPKVHPEKNAWYADTLYYLGWSHLKLSADVSESLLVRETHLQKAQEAFQKLIAFAPDENAYLALGQCCITRSRMMNDEEASAQAESYLSKPDIFVTRTGQAHALLLRAEAASSYSIRDKFYRQLTQEANRESPFYSEGWFLRGMNDFEEGQSLAKKNSVEEAKKTFDRSSYAFQKAYAYASKHGSHKRAGLAVKYQALSYEFHGSHEGLIQALAVLENLILQEPHILLSMDHPDEIYYLHGSIAAKLDGEGEEEKFADIAERSLNQGVTRFPTGKYAEEALSLLGSLQYRKGNYQKAEDTFLQLAKNYPQSSLAGDAWFWAAKCADQLEKPMEVRQQRRQMVFDSYPNSFYAAEAYFSFYPYKDYIQGDRTLIKHLQALEKKFPTSLFVLHANYLIGLDSKRDRKTLEGKWIRKKNLTSAIDAFQGVETAFDSLLEKGMIPEDKLAYYTSIRYQAILERALANLAIADESLGAKRQIYLEYAEEVFRHLVQDFESPQANFTRHLVDREPYHPIYEESTFWLAQTYVRENDDDAAEKVFANMLDRYQKGKITRSYYLSRVWYEQGKIALRRKENALALEFFRHAEDAAKGKILTTEQKLDLWIQQSTCLKELNQSDQAILILSKVVNDDAISGLRLKAMLLRAEIYETQGRRELARKQLESIAKKGGEWALKAKEKLEKEYGY